MSLAMPNSDLFDKIDQTIHPDCEMLKTACHSFGDDDQAHIYYFYSANYFIRNFLKFFETQNVKLDQLSVVDFAAGYGRLARFFVHIFKEVTISDLEQEMMDFGHKRFGVKTHKSTTELDRGLGFPSKYDVLNCFSLFTHLNPDVWDDWFWALFSLVKINGYMVISIRSPELAERFTKIRHANDISFRPKNETSGRIDNDFYGETTVSEKYIAGMMLNDNSIDLAGHFKMGDFDLYHDIYIFKKIAERPSGSMSKRMAYKSLLFDRVSRLIRRIPGSNYFF